MAVENDATSCIKRERGLRKTSKEELFRFGRTEMKTKKAVIRSKTHEIRPYCGSISFLRAYAIRPYIWVDSFFEGVLHTPLPSGDSFFEGVRNTPLPSGDSSIHRSSNASLRFVLSLIEIAKQGSKQVSFVSCSRNVKYTNRSEPAQSERDIEDSVRVSSIFERHGQAGSQIGLRDQKKFLQSERGDNRVRQLGVCIRP